MYRLTTPTHTFTLPFECETIRELIVSYGQNNTEVLSKRIADCVLEGSTVVVHLTQAETKLFTPDVPVDIQIRILTKQGNALASVKYKVQCEDVLNDEVLS